MSPLISPNPCPFKPPLCCKFSILLLKKTFMAGTSSYNLFLCYVHLLNWSLFHDQLWVSSEECHVHLHLWLAEVQTMAYWEFHNSRCSYIPVSQNTIMFLQPVLQACRGLPNVYLCTFNARNGVNYSLLSLHWDLVLGKGSSQRRMINGWNFTCMSSSMRTCLGVFKKPLISGKVRVC